MSGNAPVTPRELKVESEATDNKLRAAHGAALVVKPEAQVATRTPGGHVGEKSCRLPHARLPLEHKAIPRVLNERREHSQAAVPADAARRVGLVHGLSRSEPPRNVSKPAPAE